MDRLEEMFHLQHKLQVKTYGYDFASMSNVERIEFIRINVLALTDELHEALAETGWKPWATSNHVNEFRYMGELVDAFHFFMNLIMVVVPDPRLMGNVLYTKYTAKNRVNIQRQVDGYDGVKEKCPKCKRAYDDGITCYADGRGVIYCYYEKA